MRTVLVGAAVAGAAAFAPSAMPGANIRVRAVAAPQLRAASARRAQVRPLKIPATDPMPIPPISKTTGRGEDTARASRLRDGWASAMPQPGATQHLLRLRIVSVRT
jgi:hypothetical protein